jgi:site-specific recombinase XerD
MAKLSQWMSDEGLAVGELNRDRVESFAFAEGRLSMRAMVPLVDHLVGVGAIPAFRHPVPNTPAQVLIGRYQRYLQDERALSVSSIRNYVGVARLFLSYLSDRGDLDLGAVSAGVVTEFVMEECRRGKVASSKAMTTRLRSLLRFLHVDGFTPGPLVEAVPSVAGWRLSSLPKALASPEVARLLRSCDRRTSIGRRDFAILMLLSRLGLRAGEVARLTVGDIDWRAGELVVRGKGAREDRLPLPVDVGEAVVGWLQRGRPRCADTSVFLRARAPRRGLSSGGVSMVVRHACERAGLPRAGAHRLRHTAATEMLRAGGSLAEVGQVLRHRSHETTSIYAKVDRRALSMVVRPWPGAVS